MQDSVGPSLAALRRKLRALTALTQDRGATPSERANAAVLKRQLEERLRQAGAPAGDWTDRAFRLGRWTKEMRQSGPLEPANGDWTEQARHLGKVVGRFYKNWFSD